MILICGAGRSGTSLTTSILQACGANLGAVNGLYENTAVRQTVLKPYLKACGADPLGQRRLPGIGDLVDAPGFRDRVLDAMGHLPEPWAYKDAKIALTWPTWRDAFPEAKWVLVRRSAEAIARSCARTRFMKAYGDRWESWMPWVQQYVDRLEAIRRAMPEDTYEIWPRRAIDAGLGPFRELVDWLGLTWNDREARKRVDPRRLIG